eukprot:TRINITY_DN6140_c0_g1_i1.p1 TRINITY_DN6140_c0_g1~~TRINITY_DN6140_c0_g1_i1.p1  ORF type:complete len:113 (-),score=10.78 TRINITY_DN6140_c0_g1_i1:225-563(-)
MRDNCTQVRRLRTSTRTQAAKATATTAAPDDQNAQNQEGWHSLASSKPHNKTEWEEQTPVVLKNVGKHSNLVAMIWCKSRFWGASAGACFARHTRKVEPQLSNALVRETLTQ